MANPARDGLFQIYSEALAAVDGRTRVRDWLQANPLAGPIVLLAVGKAACAMARGALDVLASAIIDALLITKHGHGQALPWPVIEAGHPLPDAASLAAGGQLDDWIARIPLAAKVLVLLSGGASALLEQLPAGVTLANLQQLNQWLLASGLDIRTVNAVRQRLSRIKGGRLAERLAPRTVWCLAISDVPGDDPRVIGSGPLSPSVAPVDDSHLPEFVRAWLAGTPPPPAPDAACFYGLRYAIVANNADARTAAARAAEQRGFRARVDRHCLAGDAVATGMRLARVLRKAPRGWVHVWGGETTVVLPPSVGRGGRCQQLALAAAQQIAGCDAIQLLAAGTDGSDGPGEDAGALVDGGTIARGEAGGLRAAEALAHADAGRFLAASGDLVQTGPTGTNVMDLVLGLRL